eukprot:3699777-Prymnesium_polylepis.1
MQPLHGEGNFIPRRILSDFRNAEALGGRGGFAVARTSATPPAYPARRDQIEAAHDLRRNHRGIRTGQGARPVDH